MQPRHPWPTLAYAPEFLDQTLHTLLKSRKEFGFNVDVIKNFTLSPKIRPKIHSPTKLIQSNRQLRSPKLQAFSYDLLRSNLSQRRNHFIFHNDLRSLYRFLDEILDQFVSVVLSRRCGTHRFLFLLVWFLILCLYDLISCGCNCLFTPSCIFFYILYHFFFTFFILTVFFLLFYGGQFNGLLWPFW